MAKRLGKSRREAGEIPLTQPEESVFDDGLTPAEIPVQDIQTVFEDAPLAVAPPPPEIIAVERDMTPDQRAEFVALLDKKMSLDETATKLVRLAHMRGSKTAAVGLRAIMEINRLRGMGEGQPKEAAPMFGLPQGANVSINIEKVER